MRPRETDERGPVRQDGDSSIRRQGRVPGFWPTHLFLVTAAQERQSWRRSPAQPQGRRHRGPSRRAPKGGCQPELEMLLQPKLPDQLAASVKTR